MRARRSARRASSSRRRPSNRWWSSAMKASASSVRTWSKPSWIGPLMSMPALTAGDHTCTRSGHYANMCSIMVVCVLLKRLPLIAALGGTRRELIGEPVALAPEPGREQRVGEVSPAAEAFGIVAGMRVGEALARCPDLRLVPADPEATRGYWNAVLDRLESLGAAVESDDPGVAFFETRGLERLHGGHLEGVLAAVGRSLPASMRLGAAPSRFAAYAAAVHARPRRRPLHKGSEHFGNSGIVPDGAIRAFLAPLPIGLLRPRPGLEDLPEMLERLGVRTLGELASLPPSAVAERFGHPGLLALDLAQGRDARLEPRRPQEPLLERLALPEAASGAQLERALEMGIARLLARRERRGGARRAGAVGGRLRGGGKGGRGRSLRAVALSARFVEGGTWRVSVPLRRPSVDPDRLRLVLVPRLADLPAPAESIAVEVEAFGPPAHDQSVLVEDAGDVRRARLGEAVRHVRQATGQESLMRVLEVDPDSRLPERRAVLAPFPEERPRWRAPHPGGSSDDRRETFGAAAADRHRSRRGRPAVRIRRIPRGLGAGGLAR